MLSTRGILAAHKLRSRARFGLLLGLILVAFTATSSWAQDDASIRGTLRDATGSVIPGGTVTIKNLETASLRTLITDDSGRYEAPALPVGAFEISGE